MTDADICKTWTYHECQGILIHLWVNRHANPQYYSMVRTLVVELRYRKACA